MAGRGACAASAGHHPAPLTQRAPTCMRYSCVLKSLVRLLSPAHRPSTMVWALLNLRGAFR